MGQAKGRERADYTDIKALAEALRVKLDAAILAEAWDAVKVIGARVRELEHEDVINLDKARARRDGNGKR